MKHDYTSSPVSGIANDRRSDGGRLWCNELESIRAAEWKTGGLVTGRLAFKLGTMKPLPLKLICIYH